MPLQKLLELICWFKLNCADKETIKMLEGISESCATRKTLSAKPQRFKVSMPNKGVVSNRYQFLIWFSLTTRLLLLLSTMIHISKRPSFWCKILCDTCGTRSLLVALQFTLALHPKSECIKESDSPRYDEVSFAIKLEPTVKVLALDMMMHWDLGKVITILYEG